MEATFDVINEAKSIFNKEMEALVKTRDSLGEDFENLVELVLNCQGKVVLTGMGKPGHIATKISATLASLGTPSFFMHPGEAMHGDLGMVEKKDVIILMSYSGESEEVTRLMPVLQEIGCTTVAITGKPKSTLARECQHHFFFPEFEEASLYASCSHFQHNRPLGTR
ncbi:MAG: SIS domain-containing protein [Oscillospiraceae bacterium]